MLTLFLLKFYRRHRLIAFVLEVEQQSEKWKKIKGFFIDCTLDIFKVGI